jgi:hypothetical protein
MQMILLNGVPPVVGIALFHVSIINVIAIIVEYFFIKRRHNIDWLLLRTIFANLISLLVGLFVLWLIPNSIGSNIFQTEVSLTNFDRISLAFGLGGMFLANVIIEFPAYIIGRKTNRLAVIQVFKTVLFANLLTNIPVLFLYGVFGLE